MICDQEFRFYTGHGTGLLDPLRNLEESSIAELVDDRRRPGRASVMATFDVSGGSASWGLSAKPEVKLAALMEISNGLAQTLSVEDILPKLLDSLFKIFVQADRGFVVMRPKADGPLVVGGRQKPPRRRRRADADQPHDRRRSDERRARRFSRPTPPATSGSAWPRALPIFRSAR